MNEELTNEVLKVMAKCNEISCEDCPANKTVCIRVRRSIEKLATALLEERAKPKVWDGAPEWATIGRVCWTGKKHGEAYSKLYHRELPKTRTRIMAEEVTALVNRAIDGISIDEIETLLTKYAEELDGKE